MRLKQKSQFLRLEYRPPARLSNNIQSLVVSFDDDTSQLIELKKLDQIQSFPLLATVSSSFKLTIKSVFANEIETGGSFRIHGAGCTALAPAKDLKEDETVYVQCDDTFYNHAILNAQPFRVN